MPNLSVQSFLKISVNKHYLKKKRRKRRSKLKKQRELSKEPAGVCMSSWLNTEQAQLETV